MADTVKGSDAPRGERYHPGEPRLRAAEAVKLLGVEDRIRYNQLATLLAFVREGAEGADVQSRLWRVYSEDDVAAIGVTLELLRAQFASKSTGPNFLPPIQLSKLRRACRGLRAIGVEKPLFTPQLTWDQVTELYTVVIDGYVVELPSGQSQLRDSPVESSGRGAESLKRFVVPPEILRGRASQ